MTDEEIEALKKETLRLREENAKLRGITEELSGLVHYPDKYNLIYPAYEECLKKLGWFLQKRHESYPNGNEVLIVSRNGYVRLDLFEAHNFNNTYSQISQALSDYPLMTRDEQKQSWHKT